MERLDQIQLEPERDIVEVGADSDAESAVTDLGNDVDVEYEVDAIKYAVWKDSRDVRDDGKVGWHYGVMWKGYLKSYSDTEEFISQFSSAPGQPSLVKEFWTSVMHDPKYAADLTIKKGKREPGIPASIRGSSEPYVVETPLSLMRSWLRETKPRRRLPTWVRRREKEKLGLTIPKADSDYYVRKARIEAKKTGKVGGASAAPSVASGDESDEAMRQRQPSAGPSKPRSKPQKGGHLRPLYVSSSVGDSDGEVEASLATIVESDDDDVQILELTKGKGKAVDKRKGSVDSATQQRKRQRESVALSGVSVSDLFADDPPAGAGRISTASSSNAPTAKKAKVDSASQPPITNGHPTLAPPKPPPPRPSRVEGLSIKKREGTPPELKPLDMSYVPAYDPGQPLFLASPSSSGGASPPSHLAPLPDIDRTGTPSFGEPVAGIFDNAPVVDTSAKKHQIKELASWLTTPAGEQDFNAQPVKVAEPSKSASHPRGQASPDLASAPARASGTARTKQDQAAPLPDDPPPPSPPSSQPKPSQPPTATTELSGVADMSEVEEEVERNEHDSLFGTQSRGQSPSEQPTDPEATMPLEKFKAPGSSVNAQRITSADPREPSAPSSESATRLTAVSSWRPDAGPSNASTSSATPASARDPVKIDLPVRKGLPTQSALADLPKYQPPKGIQKMQDHTHVDPEIAEALTRKGLPIPMPARDKAGLPQRPKVSAVSPVGSASGNKSPYGPRDGKSPASSAGGTTPMHPSMQSFSALGSGSSNAGTTPAIPSGPALQRATASYVPRAPGNRITGSNNVPLGPSRSVPTGPAAAAPAAARAPLGTSGAYMVRPPAAGAVPTTGPAVMASAGHLSPVHASAEPALPVRRSFGTYNPALDPRRRHMFGSGEPAAPAPAEGKADPPCPSHPAPAPPPPDGRRSALSPPPSVPIVPAASNPVKQAVSSSGQVPGAMAHFSPRADLPDLILEVKLLRGADPMSLGRNKAAKEQAAPIDKPSLAHEDIASLLKRDGAKLRDLHTEMLDAYCLEGQVRHGAKVVEWLKVSPKDTNRPEWDTVCGKMREGKIFAAYLEPPGPTVECHFSIVFVAVSRVEALDIQLPAWSSAEVGIIALLVSLPLDSGPLPLMPNPVRPILTLSSPGKPNEPLEGSHSLLDAYGVSTDFLSSLRSKIAIFRYSHPVGPLDRLYSAVIDGFKATGVKGLAPTDTVPPHYLILSNARLAGAIRSGTLREAVQRRTSIMVLGPSLSLLPHQWRLRPVWKSGDLVTFSPTFILRSPDRFVEIMKTIRVSPNWAAYIIPGIVEWAEASWKEPQRCIEPEKAFEALTRSLFLDHQLLQFSGSAASSGGGLAVSMAPPSPHLPLACMRWMEWLQGINDENDFRGLVDRCQGVRPGQFERETKGSSGVKDDKKAAVEPGQVIEEEELLQVDLEQAQLEDLAAMRSRPDLLPYRRYLYIGEMSLDQRTRDRLGSSVELVRPDDFVAIFSGAI